MPGELGCGTFGAYAYEFIDFLEKSGQKYWQILPITPAGKGNSPYDCMSFFAGNINFIDLEFLIIDNLLAKDDLNINKSLSLKKAYKNFEICDEYLEFIENNKYWLNDYANFYENSGFVKFCQYIFHKQFFALKKYANNKGIKIIGDVPIYASENSVDLKLYPGEFLLDDTGKPKLLAGVPPDYFSDDGQLWGNPVYNWDYSGANSYKFHISRINKALLMFDLIRLDHFRAFADFWAIEKGSETAKDGVWIDGPGYDFIKLLKGAPIIAEDLGELSLRARELTKQSGFKAMKVMQFGTDKKSDHHINNHIKNAAVYSGTHDNEPLVDFLGDSSAVYNFIDYTMSSICDICIIPMQDYLLLGHEARMNIPGTASGNWKFMLAAVPHHLSEKIFNITKKNLR